MATRFFRCPSDAALAAWFGAFEEPPRMSSERTLVAGKRTRPNSVRRNQVNRSLRAHTKRWRSIGCYSPD